MWGVFRDPEHEVCGFQLYAWCLMSNPAHLLLKESPNGEGISQIMKRIGVKVVYRYNLRYERNGPLFLTDTALLLSLVDRGSFEA